MNTSKSISYLELNTELEQVLDKLQSAELDIDEAVKAYERGMELIKQLEEYLKNAENKVLKIKASTDKH